MVSRADIPALDKVFQGVSEVTGIPQDGMSGFVIIYVTADQKIGVVSSICCPGHTADLLEAELSNLRSGAVPDIIVTDP